MPSNSCNFNSVLKVEKFHLVIKLKSVLTRFLFGLFLISCSTDMKDSKAQPVPDANALIKKVLIIGVDGCRPDALTAANTPNLDILKANGTYSMDARNTGITSSGPGWSAMLTGVWENKHGVKDNSFSGSNYTTYPHFFKRVKEKYPKGHTVSISQWYPINDQIVLSNADIIKNTEDSTSDVKSKAIIELTFDDLTALFVHFDDVDHAGHGSGFSPTNPVYTQAIETVDAAIGEIFTALKARENYKNEDWAVLVSTDHGGLGTSHGGNSEEERTIFLIVSGDNIPKKEIAKTTTQVTIPPVENCLNSTTELYFENGTTVEIPNNAEHSFGAAQDFSIECRFRSDSPNDVSIVAKKDWDNGLLPGYVFSFKPSTKNFKVNVGDGTNRIDVEASEITDNEWHTVSATFDRDGLLKVYVDGELANSASMASIGNINNSLPFTIGVDGDKEYRYKGYISEVRIFNTLLEVHDIDIWKCKILDDTHPKYANLKGHWKLIEGTGTAIVDSSPIGANGTLTNGVWEDATQNHVITVSNYDNTPRIVDVAITALDHLCISAQTAWGLDGNSIVNGNCEN